MVTRIEMPSKATSTSSAFIGKTDLPMGPRGFENPLDIN